MLVLPPVMTCRSDSNLPLWDLQVHGLSTVFLQL
jgi:hypothetical protein